MSDSCGGCPYCEFPYEAQLPIKTDKGYVRETFEDTSDVWAVIDLIAQETKRLNQRKKNNFDIAESIISQIPFFTCYNHVIDEKYLKLMNRYIYCKEANVPAFDGSYGQQPSRWVQMFFIIKNALAKKNKMLKDKLEKEKKDV